MYRANNISATNLRIYRIGVLISKTKTSYQIWKGTDLCLGLYSNLCFDFR